MKNRFGLCLSALALIVSLASAKARAQCLDWSTGFESAGPSGAVHALLAIPSGPVQGLYAAGEFEATAGVATANVARWDGQFWSALGAGITDGKLPRVAALAFFNGELIAAGAFASAGGNPASNIARWNGSAWSPLGVGVDGPVYSLAIFNDGSGPALYAGGSFAKAGGSPAPFFARWNGTSWSSVAGAPAGPVTSMASAPGAFPGGGALFVGGNFSNSGAVSTSNIARWTGAAWTALGAGTNDTVHALAFHDDGSGTKLFVGGNFNTAGSNIGNPYASWNGATWSNVGPIAATEAKFDNIRAFFVHGGSLYAGGRFTSTGDVSASSIARWNGSTWVAVGGGANGTVRALAVFDAGAVDPCGPSLYAGGHFTTAGGSVRARVAKLCGASWTAVASGGGMSHSVEALTVHGSQLYAGGSFQTAGNVPANRIARWNGSTWSALASGLDGAVHALAVFDDGGGPALYAAGSFKYAGATPVNYIAKWNGASFTPLAFGLTAPVYALAVFDDGSGPALYAGGEFPAVAAVAVLPDVPSGPVGPSPHISRWNGAAWSSVGTGTNGVVRALTVHAGGLFAGGEFTSAGPLQVNYVARWNGAAWSALRKGVDAPVNALASWNGSLVAGGEFEAAGVLAARHVATWNGIGWSNLGAGCDGNVRALTAFDDGSGGGAKLFLGGDFGVAGAAPAARIARFDGASFSPLLGGVNDSVFALAVYNDGAGADLYAGGEFTKSGTKPASRIARWLGCP